MTLRRDAFGRRTFLIGAGAAAGYLGWSALSPGRVTGAALPPLPSKPVSLTVIDVAGQSQLTRASMEDYAKSHSPYVSQINFERATAPELPAKIKAQQAANQVQISLVMTGSDGLSTGIQEGIWLRLFPDYQAKFPNFTGNFIAPKAQGLTQGFGVLDTFGNYGTTWTYNPRKLTTVPKTPTDLLQWAKANPNQLIYARPANSGPGRSLVMSLPYVLGDATPRQPETWTKTWAYLDELGKYIQYYPSGTAITFQELGQGARAIAASTMGWDMNVRVLGTVPKDFGAFMFDNAHMTADTQYLTVPRGVSPDVTAVILDLIAWVLRPDQQARTYDNAYFYPGPAVKGVTLDMAPKDSQDAVRSVQRPLFDQLIKSRPIEMPLEAVPLVKAFEIWDQRIGANKQK
jgi:putative spermidine/putrescine transport system substrate-binding protein